MRMQEFVGAESDLSNIKRLLLLNFTETEVSRIHSIILQYQGELKGMLVFQEEDEEACGTALGYVDGTNNLHLTAGIQVIDRRVLSMPELMTHLVTYARGRYEAICDQLNPFQSANDELLQTYVNLGFSVDRDPAIVLARSLRKKGVEEIPENLSPQPIRDTYVSLDLK